MHSQARFGLGQDMLLAALSAVALGGLLAWIFRPASGVVAEADVPREPALGVVAVQVKDVRRRLDGMLVWNDVRQGDPVHDGDGIYVGDGGAAVVNLNAGGHIEIDDKSMVVLHPVESAATGIDLRWGGASGVAAHAPLAIQMQGAHVQVEEGSRASLRVQPDASLAITVPSGKASIQMADGPPVAVHALEKRVVDVRTGAIGPAQHLATALLTPAHAERTYVRSSTQAVTFTWQAVPKARGYTWELSADNQFRHIVATRPTHEPSVNYTGLEGGTYYWRVGVDDGRNHGTSEERAVVVINDHPPMPLGPRAGGAVDLSRKTATGGSKDLVLSWTAVPGVNHYAVELVNAGSHATTLWRSTYAGLSLSVTELIEGDYCYRVRADEPERGNSPWSHAQCFRVLTKPVLKAPKLYSPDKAAKPKETGWLWRLVGGVAVAAEGAPEALILRWEDVEGAAAYNLEIATDPAMQHVVAQERVSEAYYRWQPPERRTYYWRVRAIDVDGRAGEPSEVRQLTLGEPSPLPAAPPAKTHIPKPPTKIPARHMPAADANKTVAPFPPSAVPVSPTAPVLTPEPVASQSVAPEVPWPRGWVGARAALFTNWGNITTVEPGLEFGAWLTPTSWGALGARITADYYTSQVTEQSADRKVTVHSRLHRLPLTVSLLSVWPLQMLDLIAALGVRCAWTYTKTTVTGLPSETEGDLEGGIAFTLGGQRRLGPGALFGELGYALTSQRTGSIQDAPDGLSVAVGYRLGVF